MSKSIANIEVDTDKFNSTNETENLHLPQFIATDKPGWLTDFNGSMEVIDEAAKVLQDQVTEQFEDLEAVHEQVDRIDDEINNPETGVKQVLHDTQDRVGNLESVVGDESHGLVKDVNDLQEDMVHTNTMAVKSNAQLGSIINLLCNKYSTSAQYNQGAYVYTENEDNSLNFLRCTATTRGAFDPTKWEDVTEKLISALDNGGGGGGSQYVLPIAGDADDPDAVLGGVIVGEGLQIDENGVISRTVEPSEGIGPDYYASNVRAGLVRPNTDTGLGVNASNGLLSIIIDDNTIEFTADGKLRAKPDTSRFARGQGIDISDEGVPTISVRLAANSNLGFDGNGALKAILPASAYDLIEGAGVTITTDAVQGTKTLSLTPARTNVFGGIRPEADAFEFVNPAQDDPVQVQKMRVQLAPSRGLEKVSGSGYGVKVDGTSVRFNAQGELEATGGGGGGTEYTAADNSVTVDNTNHTIAAKLNSTGGISVDTDGLKVNTGSGIVKQGNALTVPQIGQTVNGVKQTIGTISRVQDYRVGMPGNLFPYVEKDVLAPYELAGFTPISSRLKFRVVGSATFDTFESHYNEPTLDTSVTPPVIDQSSVETLPAGTRVAQISKRSPQSPNSTYILEATNSAIVETYQCKQDFNPSVMYEVVLDSTTQEYTVALKDNFDLSSYLDDGIGYEQYNASVGIVGRGSKYIPVNRILKTGDVDPTATNELLPRVSTVYPNNKSITVPERSAYHPLMFMFPLYILPTVNFPVTSDFNNYDIDITYFVDGDTGYGNLAQRVPLFEKTINVKPSVFADYFNNTTTSVEVKDYRFGPRGDTTFYKYGCAVTYPMLVTNLVVGCRIEFTNISTGVVTRAYSEYSDDSTPDCNLYGATYLYDLVEQ